MHHNGSASCGHDYRPEDFAGMDGDAVQGAQRDQVVTDDTTPRVEHQHNESFLGRIEPASLGDVAGPVLVTALRGVDEAIRSSAFPNAHDLELERRFHGWPS